MGFDSIYGQHLLKKALQRSLAKGETGHAYLFSGSPGSGKRTLALLFSQALNCRENAPPCGECLSCRKSVSGNHPDLFRLVPQGASLKIEQIRDIKESLHYLPVEGQHKVCIMEDADLLTLPAANSLLKILEEPPSHLVFILLTARPWALLPTVLSRCSHFTLKPLQPQEMTALLEREGKHTEKQDLLFLLSGGNPGQALALVREEDWREKFVEARNLLNTVQLGSADGIFPLAEELSTRSDLSDLLEIVLVVCRDRLMHTLQGCAEAVILEEERENLHTKDLNDQNKLTLFYEKICNALLQLQAELRGNVNKRLALEVLFLQMRGVI